MSGCYLGPELSPDDVERRLTASGARSHTLVDHEILDRTAGLLADGLSVGWFQGRMEFGPGALGHRSILADPRRPETQRKLNLQIKYRESFRPFAPMVLVEDLEEWFELSEPSPYMLLVAPVAEGHRQGHARTDDGSVEHGSEPPRTDTDRQGGFPTDSDRLDDALAELEQARGLEKLGLIRSDIPAVTRVDYSARVQSVSADQSPQVHALLRAFKERTGCPVLGKHELQRARRAHRMYA